MLIDMFDPVVLGVIAGTAGMAFAAIRWRNNRIRRRRRQVWNARRDEEDRIWYEKTGRGG